MKQKAQDQIDDSIRMGECIRKEGEVIHIDIYKMFVNLN